MAKKLKKVFQLVPIKKGMALIFLLSSLVGYAIMVYFPYAASQIIGQATVGNINTAFYYAISLGIAYIIYETFWFFNYYLYSKLQTHYCDYLHHRFFDKIASSSRNFTKQIDKGKMLMLVGDDIPSFCLLLDSAITYISSVFLVAIIFILLLKTNLIFTSIIAISTIVYILFVKKATEKFAVYLREQKKHNDAINSIYIEELAGLKEIKTLPITKRLQKNLDTKLKRYTKTYFKKRKYYVRMENTSNLFPYYTKFILYLIFLFFMVACGARIELVILIIGYYDQIIESLDDMITAYREVEEYNVSVERVEEVLTYQDNLPLLFGQYEGDMIYGAITLENVSYKYNSKLILNNVNIKIKPNTLTVIVGKSGSGKTTILDLLLRFYPVTSGTIYLDGRNIYDYSDSIHASNITMVKQNPFLYSMSIDHNLKLVNSSKKRRIEACMDVGIHPFIMSLKKGYKTVLKQNARNLSGGQKQLLSIARSLLTDAEILLMDDITSSLDPNTTHHIIELLKELKHSHTIITVTNREDLIKSADQIIYLKEGHATTYHTYEKFIEKTKTEREVLADEGNN